MIVGNLARTEGGGRWAAAPRAAPLHLKPVHDNGGQYRPPSVVACGWASHLA